MSMCELYSDCNMQVTERSQAAQVADIDRDIAVLQERKARILQS